MPLAACFECSRQVSTEAAACPHCGAPHPTRVAGPLIDKDRRSTIPTKSKSLLGPIIGGVVVTGIFLFMVASLVGSLSNQPPRSGENACRTVDGNITCDGQSAAAVSSGEKRSRTGVPVGHCSYKVIDTVDQLNVSGGRAKIWFAACRSDGSVMWLNLRANDGREMEWKPDEGTNELASRIAFGR